VSFGSCGSCSSCGSVPLCGVELWFHLQIMYLLDGLVSIRDSFVTKESHCEQDQVEYLLSGIHTFL
jgi:hypothetical protein